MKTVIKYICIYLIMMTIVKCDYKGVPDERIFSMNALIKDFRINIDDEFIIQVAGNPTTGYSWYLDNNSDETHLEALNLNQHKSSKDYEVNDHPVGFTGVGGVYYFRFKGVQKGTYFLLFINKRIWEKTNLKERRVTIHIE